MRCIIAGCATLILLTLAESAQKEDIPNLKGEWEQDGVVKLINQRGNQIWFRGTDINSNVEYEGTLSGRKVSATELTVFSYEDCPKVRMAYKMELALSDSGDVLSGTLKKPENLHKDCSTSPGGQIPIRFTRLKIPPRPSPQVQPADSIFLIPGQNSAIVGRRIHVDIWISGKNARRVIADRNYEIDVSAEGGTVEPSRVEILQGQSAGTTYLSSDHPGDVRVHASSTGLKPATQSTTFCLDDDITNIELVKTTEQAPANGTTAIPMQIKFLDARGAPTTGHQTKGLGFDLRGVGLWRPAMNSAWAISSELDVARDECMGAIEFVSTVPGRTTATVNFVDQSRKRDFLFTLTWTWVLLSMLGALIGTVARLIVRFRKSQTLRYFAAEGVVGMVSGVIVMLAAYAGMAHYTVPTEASVLGFFTPCLFGLIGGYLGKGALDKVSKLATSVGRITNSLHQHVSSR